MFERQMVAYEIDKAQWAFLLAPKRSGKAQQAYMAIDQDDASDYDVIKKATAGSFGIGRIAPKSHSRI